MVEKYSFELFQVHLHLHILVGRQEMGQKRYWFYFWYRSNRLIEKKNTLYKPFMLECAYELQKKLQSYLSLKYRHDWWIMLNIDYF